MMQLLAANHQVKFSHQVETESENTARDPKSEVEAYEEDPYEYEDDDDDGNKEEYQDEYEEKDEEIEQPQRNQNKKHDDEEERRIRAEEERLEAEELAREDERLRLEEEEYNRQEAARRAHQQANSKNTAGSVSDVKEDQSSKNYDYDVEDFDDEKHYNKRDSRPISSHHSNRPESAQHGRPKSKIKQKHEEVTTTLIRNTYILTFRMILTKSRRNFNQFLFISNCS